MPATAETSCSAADGDRLARRNATILALCQALAGANNTVIVGTAGIVGSVLAGDKSLATLPISTFVVGVWVATLPIGVLAKRFGRLVAFEAGAFCGMIAGLLCALAVLKGSFVLLCAGSTFGGFYAAGHQSYRFAAADTASPAFKPRAISWVLAGGVLAGVFGPQLVILTKDMWQPYMFAASYLAQAVVALVAAVVLTLVKFPRPPAVREPLPRGRALTIILRQPKFLVAIVCGIASYSMMNFVMTSAPVAMVACNHSITDATLGLQWHVMAMYAPSFFTGSLIARYGTFRIVGLGLSIIGASAVVGLSGLTIWHFWSALVLLGIGWNFSFVGATAMVTDCHLPEERNKVQSVNDFFIFGAMAVGSFSSGQLLARYGWTMVNEVVFPFVLVALVLLAALALVRRWRPAAARPEVAWQAGDKDYGATAPLH
ncbi:MAG: MFS transporter [Proteobacteria bacterium]|nr:MFS transporter [Pseudomonadota bacterium]